MGYRLCVEKVGDKEPSYYGTKMYGYGRTTEYKSYKWLLENDFLKKDEHYIWGDGFDNPILMRIEQFKEFVKLYNEDCNDEYLSYYPEDKDFFINNEDIQKFLQLYPWELVVLTWG